MNDVGRVRLTAIIMDLCEQAGCDKETRKKHLRQFFHRWNPHPSMRFKAWWEPFERDPLSGADIGGHPESRRQWSRKDPDGYEHRTYGIPTETAYNMQSYREEYEAWILLGCPERPEPFVSTAATVEQQQNFWHGLAQHVNRIGKQMPQITAGDVALEEEHPRTPPDP